MANVIKKEMNLSVETHDELYGASLDFSDGCDIADMLDLAAAGTALVVIKVLENAGISEEGQESDLEFYTEKLFERVKHHLVGLKVRAATVH